MTVRQITIETTIVAVTCGECDIQFGLGKSFQASREEDHKSFYCPNGHHISYNGPTEADRLKKQLALVNRQREWAETAVRAARDQAKTAEYRRRAEKGAKTKLQARITNGVCPCCHRSFTELASHMADKHPNYPKEKDS